MVYMEDCGVDGRVDKTQDLNIKSQCSLPFQADSPRYFDHGLFAC